MVSRKSYRKGGGALVRHRRWVCHRHAAAMVRGSCGQAKKKKQSKRPTYPVRLFFYALSEDREKFTIRCTMCATSRATRRSIWNHGQAVQHAPSQGTAETHSVWNAKRPPAAQLSKMKATREGGKPGVKNEESPPPAAPASTQLDSLCGVEDGRSSPGRS